MECPAKGYQKNLSTHHQEWQGPMGWAHRSQVSGVPKEASLVHFAPLAQTCLPFFSVKIVLLEGAGGGEAGIGPFILIFLWKWESGSSVALPPSVALHNGLVPSAWHCRLAFTSASFPFQLVTANMAHAHVGPKKPGSLSLVS